MGLTELYKRKDDLISQMRAITDTAEKENRDLNEEDEKKWADLEKDVDSVTKTIEREEKMVAHEQEVRSPKRKLFLNNVRIKHDDPEEFRAFSEFLWAARQGSDKRLEYREQSMGSGVEGGFMVPEKWRPTLLSVEPQAAIFRPRATIIGAMDPPDSALSQPKLDQSAAENIYGGIVLDWVAEGGTKPLTDLRLKEFRLEPKEAAGYLVTTDKLLRNWQGSSAFFTQQFRKAMIGFEDTVFYSGNGVGKPQGILNAAARIEYARGTANQIAYADIVGMYARAKLGGNLFWLTSQTCIPQLCTMTDNTTNMGLVWQQSAVPGMPPTLMGIPVLFHDRAKPLGTKGDLCLLNLEYYYIMDGSGPFVAFSEHVYFTQNKTVIKIFWNVDGQSWLDAPLPLEGSTTNTVSPFIILA